MFTRIDLMSLCFVVSVGDIDFLQVHMQTYRDAVILNPTERDAERADFSQIVNYCFWEE